MAFGGIREDDHHLRQLPTTDEFLYIEQINRTELNLLPNLLIP